MKLTGLMIKMLQSGADAPDRSLRDVDGRALSGLIRRRLVDVTRGEQSSFSRRKGWWVKRMVITDVKINDAGRAALAEATATSEPREPRERTMVPIGAYFQTPGGTSETLKRIIDVPEDVVRWVGSSGRVWVASECMVEAASEWTAADNGLTEYHALELLASRCDDPSAKGRKKRPLYTLGTLPHHADSAVVQQALRAVGHLTKARLGEHTDAQVHGLQVAPATHDSVVAGWYVAGDLTSVYNNPVYTSPELEIIAHAFQKAGWKAMIGRHHVRAVMPSEKDTI